MPWDFFHRHWRFVITLLFFFTVQCSTFIKDSPYAFTIAFISYYKDIGSASYTPCAFTNIFFALYHESICGTPNVPCVFTIIFVLYHKGFGGTSNTPCAFIMIFILHHEGTSSAINLWSILINIFHIIWWGYFQCRQYHVHLRSFSSCIKRLLAVPPIHHVVLQCFLKILDFKYVIFRLLILSRIHPIFF